MFCATYSWLSSSNLRDLGVFLRVGANDAHAGEILLHAAADIGEHFLDHFEAIVNAFRPNRITAMLTSGAGIRQSSVSRQSTEQHDRDGEAAR